MQPLKKLAFEQLYGDIIVFPTDLAIGTDTTHPRSFGFATKVKNLVCEAQEQTAESQLSQKQ